MIHLMHEEHGLLDFFLKSLLKRSMRVQANLVDQLLNSSEKPLARILLLMAESAKPDGPDVPSSLLLEPKKFPFHGGCRGQKRQTMVRQRREAITRRMHSGFLIQGVMVLVCVLPVGSQYRKAKENGERYAEIAARDALEAADCCRTRTGG